MAALDPKAWAHTPDDALYAVSDLDATPLRALAMRTRYSLIASGALASVRIGTRRYVTKRAVLEFIRSRESAGALTRSSGAA